MGRLIQRLVRRNRSVSPRRAAMELLEGRRLFTLLCSLNGDVLTVVEQNDGISNATTMQVVNGSLQVSDANDVMNENQALYNIGWRSNSDFSSVTGPETGISSIVVDTDDGKDTLSIPNLNLPVIIQPRGAANETVQLGQADTVAGAQDITGAITIDATHASSAEIDFDEQMDPTDLDPTINSGHILDLAGAPINFTAPPQGNSTSAPLAINVLGGTGRCAYAVEQNPGDANIDYAFLAKGQETVGLESLNAGSQAAMIADAGGSERVLLGSAGLISGLKGNVLVNAAGGTATLSIDDHNDTTAHTFAVNPTGGNFIINEDGSIFAQLNDPGCNALTLDTGTASNTVNLNLDGFPGTAFVTTVQSGGSDTINVNQVPTQGLLDIIGGPGINRVILSPKSDDGTVNIVNSIGQESVVLDGSDITTPQVIAVNDSTVTGMGTGTYSFAKLTTLSIVGGSAFDNFTVTPSATVAISVDGGPTTGAATDRLDVITTGVSGTALSLQATTTDESGIYTFTNRQQITFSHLATITPTIGDITGIVYNAQTVANVASATVIVDENNNGVADAGEPTAVTDSNGVFSFTSLPTGAFGLLVQDAGFQNLGTSSITISAGVLAPPIAVPIVPTTTAGGPDLVASVSAVASGKTGSARPKVHVKMTNSGADMTSAAPLQIILAASTDTTFDPTDTILLSAFSASVLLKSNKSKTLTFTGSTGSSLAKGNYYILAAIDTANAIAESNESNNIAATSTPLSLAPAAVDLSGKFAKLPRTAVKAKPFFVNIALQNLGTIAAAGTVDFDIYASTDQTLDGSDIQLGVSLPISAHVAAGKSQTARFKLSLSSLPVGSYYLIAKVNSTSSIAESDTTNDTVFSATPIAVS